ncbi:uncharacterized protein B0I36DRAFT_131812 [Microdochium trichocladiopsis]|uniref:Uncharacterized protein n=1 Tax=Microdochium trichocladiopsis TaxID=1682393 RepID=A0A9P8Y5F8_9PEZI|nr:uncharacterized protein B0I36DRAFT_131812 [Microdochium trichocladiopsis]KAH7029370.1 hypothetical protein B0I36DRAFT_131812 [Microdochium trichocladiopsis]
MGWLPAITQPGGQSQPCPGLVLAQLSLVCACAWRCHWYCVPHQTLSAAQPTRSHNRLALSDCLVPTPRSLCCWRSHLSNTLWIVSLDRTRVSYFRVWQVRLLPTTTAAHQAVAQQQQQQWVSGIRSVRNWGASLIPSPTVLCFAEWPRYVVGADRPLGRAVRDANEPASQAHLERHVAKPSRPCRNPLRDRPLQFAPFRPPARTPHASEWPACARLLPQVFRVSSSHQYGAGPLRLASPLRLSGQMPSPALRATTAPSL